MRIGKKTFCPRIGTVTLNPALDKIFAVERFTVGHDHRCRNPYLSAGGKGINVSRVLATLGVPNITTGFLAGHSGATIARILTEERIQHDFVSIKGESRSTVTIVDRNNHCSTRLLEEGPRIHTVDINRLLRKIGQVAHRCDYVVFSGKTVPGAPERIYQQLIQKVQRQGKKAVLDTSGPALRRAISMRPFLIKPNLAEAEGLLGKKMKTLDGMIKAIQEWHSTGISQVLLTLGARGVLASDGNELLSARLTRFPAMHTVGNGDALLAGFLAVLSQGGTFREAVTLGVACGAANASYMIPGAFSRAQALKLRPLVVVRKIKRR